MTQVSELLPKVPQCNESLNVIITGQDRDPTDIAQWFAAVIQKVWVGDLQFCLCVLASFYLEQTYAQVVVSDGLIIFILQLSFRHRI